MERTHKNTTQLAERGVIHAKTEGTILNPVVIPPINLEEMVKNDLMLLGLDFSDPDKKERKRSIKDSCTKTGISTKGLAHIFKSMFCFYSS